MSEKSVDDILKDHNIITIKKDGKELDLSEGKIKQLASKLIDLMGEEALLLNDFGKNAKLVSLLIETKKAWWPATQKSLSANVNFDKELEKWYVLQKELIDKDKEKVIEVIANEE